MQMLLKLGYTNLMLLKFIEKWCTVRITHLASSIQSILFIQSMIKRCMNKISF